MTTVWVDSLPFKQLGAGGLLARAQLPLGCMIVSKFSSDKSRVFSIGRHSHDHCTSQLLLCAQGTVGMSDQLSFFGSNNY